MSRAKRMHVVQKVTDERESRQAAQLGASQRQVLEAERKLLELERYQSDYQREFRTRAQSGGSSLGLRDFHAFLARLNEAVIQQKLILQRARQEQRNRFSIDIVRPLRETNDG